MPNVNPIADTAYTYIERYKDLVKDATRRLNDAGACLITATDTLNYDEARFAYLDDLFKRLEQTDKSYNQIKNIIDRSVKLSKTIVANVHFVAEAIERLMCSVRRMSESADSLKAKIDTFKAQLNNLDKNNGLYKKLLELEDKNNEAINANKEAIKKSLETLKEVYILHVNLAGRTRQLMVKIAEYRNKYIVFYGAQNITESCGSVDIFEQCSDEMQGLVSHFEWLQKLLNEDNAYPFDNLTDDEKRAVPCKPSSGITATFPLNKSGGYLSVIMTEKTAAETARTKSKESYQKALSNRDGVQAELSGYQAALKAAEDARKVTAA